MLGALTGGLCMLGGGAAVRSDPRNTSTEKGTRLQLCV